MASNRRNEFHNRKKKKDEAEEAKLMSEEATELYQMMCKKFGVEGNSDNPNIENDDDLKIIIGSLWDKKNVAEKRLMAAIKRLMDLVEKM